MKARKKIGYASKSPSRPRKQWWKDSSLSRAALKAIKAAYADELTGFENDKATDFEWPILTGDQVRSPVFEIVEKADRTEKLDPVIALIAARPLMDEWERNVVADCLYRHLIHKRLPIYEQSESDKNLAEAKKHVAEKMRQERLSKEDAITEVARDMGIPRTTLQNSIDYKRDSERRQRKGFRGAASKRKAAPNARKKGAGAK
ncbi:MAG: hypothetical protein P8Y71_07270 [Pseudolabrys sp.]|jgi:hypothetical protein